METQATVTIACDEPQTLAAALQPDNDGHLAHSVADGSLTLLAEGSIMSVLRTLDDALGCLRATGLD